ARAWTSMTVVPGRKPVTGLVAALAPRLGLDEASLTGQLLTDPEEVLGQLRRTLGTTGGLLLFVDQLEELVTCDEPDESAVAARFLGMLADQPFPGLKLLATVRGDFLTRLAALPGLGAALGRAVLILRPLSEEGIRQIVTGPANATGIRFESEGLIARLVSSASEEGALPLLQFTLAALWDGRDPATGVITEQALERIGGVEGALAQHADAVLATLSPAGRSAARRMLLRLV